MTIRETFLRAVLDWDNLPAYSSRAIFDGRKAAAEEALLSAASEFTDAPKGRTRELFRGVTLTTREQVTGLLAGETIEIPHTRLSSWTRRARTALDFASEWASCGNGVVIRMERTRLDVLVDVGLLMKRMTEEERRRFPISMSAVLEREVIVKNEGPSLTISRNDVDWMNPCIHELLETDHLDELAREARETREEAEALQMLRQP